MAGLGYGGVAQTKAAAHGGDFMLALFYKQVGYTVQLSAVSL